MAGVDIYLDWGGDIDWAASGDVSVATGVTLANQRLARRLFTNPEERSADGTVTQVGDYPLEQTYGKGLGKTIEQLDTPDRRNQIMNAIREAVREEYELIDQKIPPVIDFFDRRETGLLGVTIQYTLRDGSRGRLAFEL